MKRQWKINTAVHLPHKRLAIYGVVVTEKGNSYRVQIIAPYNGKGKQYAGVWIDFLDYPEEDFFDYDRADIEKIENELMKRKMVVKRGWRRFWNY